MCLLAVNVSINSIRKLCSAPLSSFYFHNTFLDVEEQLRVSKSFTVVSNFISCDEEIALANEAEKVLKRLRYEADHWDSAILGYRETEKKDWTPENAKVVQRVKETAFNNGAAMPLVHILDLKADGVIKPHVDSVKFCGSIIAGISLLTDAVMRLARENQPELCVDVLLPRRSLYIMRGPARYEFTHAILSGEESVFNGRPVVKHRRISIICRNDPSE